MKEGGNESRRPRISDVLSFLTCPMKYGLDRKEVHVPDHDALLEVTQQSEGQQERAIVRRSLLDAIRLHSSGESTAAVDAHLKEMAGPERAPRVLDCVRTFYREALAGQPDGTHMNLQAEAELDLDRLLVPGTSFVASYNGEIVVNGVALPLVVRVVSKRPSETELRNDRELTAVAFGYWAREGMQWPKHEERAVCVAYLVLNKKPVSYVAQTTRTLGDVMRLSHDLRNTQALIRVGCYPRNYSWLCGTCEQRKPCEAALNKPTQ